jgi:hypothetical protein
MSNTVPIFRARIVHGKPRLYDRDGFRSHCEGLDGQEVDLIVRKHRAQRSSQQNRYYHGVVVKMLAEHCGYDAAEMHETLAMRFLRIEDCPVTGAPRRKRTPKTDTKEFSDYVNACLRLGAELGLYIPEAGEVEAA